MFKIHPLRIAFVGIKTPDEDTMIVSKLPPMSPPSTSRFYLQQAGSLIAITQPTLHQYVRVRIVILEVATLQESVNAALKLSTFLKLPIKFLVVKALKKVAVYALFEGHRLYNKEPKAILKALPMKGILGITTFNPTSKESYLILTNPLSAYVELVENYEKH